MQEELMTIKIINVSSLPYMINDDTWVVDVEIETEFPPLVQLTHVFYKSLEAASLLKAGDVI